MGLNGRNYMYFWLWIQLQQLQLPQLLSLIQMSQCFCLKQYMLTNLNSIFKTLNKEQFVNEVEKIIIYLQWNK